MFSLLWIPATIAASIFQVVRNALQRGMMSTTGPWGATLVRFLFGLPFSIVFVLLVSWMTPDARPHFDHVFFLAAASGALAQVLATASLLVAMERAGFAVGTALQQSSLPLAAVIGLIVYNDRISGIAWIGVAITTVGLVLLSWPSHVGPATPRRLSGALFGLISGLCFGFSLNAFRHAALALDAGHPIFSALASVLVVQAIQASLLTACLLILDRKALIAVILGWRQSLAAGLCGACASAGWFIALALSPAAPVRALGVIEAPIAAIAGRRLFQERLHAKQILAGLAVIVGVVLTTLY
ncbi:MAG: multidrug transporter [Sphingomonadales bacterium]|nr:multidrug transporter [Sphingomonadales bacterium]